MTRCYCFRFFFYLPGAYSGGFISYLTSENYVKLPHVNSNYLKRLTGTYD
jgi:hypothetical protein